MGWPEIIERLHLEGKLSAVRVDKAKIKGLITADDAKKIKEKQRNLANKNSQV